MCRRDVIEMSKQRLREATTGRKVPVQIPKYFATMILFWTGTVTISSVDGSYFILLSFTGVISTLGVLMN